MPINVKNEQLKAKLEARKAQAYDEYTKVLTQIEAGEKLDALVTELEPIIGTDWRLSYDATKIFAHVWNGNKASFTETVMQLSKVLKEPPNITVTTYSYSAIWDQLEFDCYGATDCKMIEEEVTTTQKISKPHPECVAALSTLENI